jgi:hypothetical protein
MKEMPLLLFIMLEAAETTYPGDDPNTKGQCLGAIGSFILAEFFFREFWRTYDFIEGDETVESELKHLFKGGPPATMPALIEEIANRKGWTKPEAKFW